MLRTQLHPMLHYLHSYKQNSVLPCIKRMALFCLPKTGLSCLPASALSLPKR